MKKLSCYCDGGARRNPGPAGIGVVVFDETGQVVYEISEYIGETTNNQAEYRAVLACVESLAERGATHAEFFLDSQLVVRQINGEYKVKNAGIKPLYAAILEIIAGFECVTFSHIPREKNKHADMLANRAMDRAKG